MQTANLEQVRNPCSGDAIHVNTIRKVALGPGTQSACQGPVLNGSALAPCRTWAYVLAGLLAAGGCSRPEGQGGGMTAAAPDTLATARAEAYERPERRLTTAAFVRPSLDTKLARRLVYLAPLIMQEPWDPAAETPTFQRFGAVRLDQDGQPQVETDRLTVYFFPSQATLGGREHEIGRAHV